MFFWNRKKQPKTLRSRLRSLGIIFALASALHISMPEWLASLVATVTGSAAPATAGINASPSERGFLANLYERVMGGGVVATQEGDGNSPSQAPSQSHRPPADFTGGTSAANQPRLSPQAFAAFATLRLRPGEAERLADSPPPLTAKPGNAPWRKVERVLDGDTVIVDGNQVRLMGIDCPEMEDNDKLRIDMRQSGVQQPADMLALGRTAHAFTRQLAEGRSCWLEFDHLTKDANGAYLAYVYLEDGTNLNETILYSGYAKTSLESGFRYMKRYMYLQEEAMRRGHGLWKGN